jgi:hypothetical protein
MSELQLLYTIGEKHESTFKENLNSAPSSPLFTESMVEISQLADGYCLK